MSRAKSNSKDLSERKATGFRFGRIVIPTNALGGGGSTTLDAADLLNRLLGRLIYDVNLCCVLVRMQYFCVCWCEWVDQSASTKTTIRRTKATQQTANDSE